jgi:hypothetical protein
MKTAMPWKERLLQILILVMEYVFYLLLLIGINVLAGICIATTCVLVDTVIAKKTLWFEGAMMKVRTLLGLIIVDFVIIWLGLALHCVYQHYPHPVRLLFVVHDQGAAALTLAGGFGLGRGVYVGLMAAFALRRCSESSGPG